LGLSCSQLLVPKVLPDSSSVTVSSVPPRCSVSRSRLIRARTRSPGFMVPSTVSFLE
jgi:hypothetical protein